MPEQTQSAYGIAKIEKLVFGGSGLFRDPTWGVCFVDGVLPGETIRFRIDLEHSPKKLSKRSFHNACLLEIVEAAAQRVVPQCPHYSDCGGCDWQHISYAMQMQLKQDIAIESLQRLAASAVTQTAEAPKDLKMEKGRNAAENFWAERMQATITETSITEVPTSETPISEKTEQNGAITRGWAYRQRAKFYPTKNEAGQITLGFRRKGSHDTLPVPQCKILAPEILRSIYASSDASLGFLPDAKSREPVYIFAGEQVSTQEFRYQTVLPVKIAGDGEALNEALNEGPNLDSGAELSLKGEARLFFQGNAKVLPLLLGELQASLQPLLAEWQGAFLDLYAGVGLFSLFVDALLPKNAPRFAVEHSKAAFRYLQQNLEATSYQCDCNDVASFLRLHSSGSENVSSSENASGGGNVSASANSGASENSSVLRGSFIFADPPRGGMSAEVSRLCNDSEAAYILYLSCDAASFARDVARLSEYRMLYWRLVDFYPQTHHIELYALFEKVQSGE